MRCDKIKRFLSRYIDKELVDKKLKALIEKHLDICPHCQAEFNALVKVKGLIAEKGRITVGGEFLVGLKNRLEPEAPVIRLRWLPEAGDLARRLIPVPVVIMILMLSLVFTRLNGAFSPVDEYIFSDLTNEEMGILSGYIGSSDLLTNVVFK